MKYIFIAHRSQGFGWACRARKRTGRRFLSSITLPWIWLVVDPAAAFGQTTPSFLLLRDTKTHPRCQGGAYPALAMSAGDVEPWQGRPPVTGTKLRTTHETLAFAYMHYGLVGDGTSSTLQLYHHLLLILNTELQCNVGEKSSAMCRTALWWLVFNKHCLCNERRDPLPLTAKSRCTLSIRSVRCN